MENIFEKSSLYDVLTSLFIGAILVWSLTIIGSHMLQCCSQCCQISHSCTYIYIIAKHYIGQFIFISYFCGLLWHRLIEGFVCNRFQDSSCHFFTSPFCRNQLSLIKKQYNKLIKRFNIDRIIDNENMLEEYHNSYYRLIKDNNLGNVPTLEASSALVKDLIFVLPLFSIALCLNGNCTCRIILISLLIEIALFTIRYSCESKIHYLIGNRIIFSIRDSGKKVVPCLRLLKINMKQRRRAEIIVIISCIIFVFGHLNCYAHGSGNVHVAEMFSVLPFKTLPNGAATTENQPVTEWLGMITSDLIDNYWGKECPEFNNKCFYDYLRDEFGFRCKHRLLFHWGFNAQPWTDELEKKISQYGWNRKSPF